MKSERSMRPLILVGVVVSACGGPAGPVGGAVSDGGRSGFVELMANDPLRRSFDFGRGAFGTIVQENEIRNAGSHIEYSNYHLGELSVGLQGGETGAIVDVGSDESVAAQLGVAETLGSGQGYAHLVLSGGRFSVPKADAVLDSVPSGVGHIRPELGHVYVVRIVDSHTKKELLVKLLIVGLQEKSDVAFEWELLSSGS